MSNEVSNDVDNIINEVNTINTDEIIDKYLMLKQQEAEVKQQLEHIKKTLESTGLNEFSNGKARIFKKDKKMISYNENIKDLLKIKNIFEACVVPDKSKMQAMVKAKFLTVDEMKPYEQVKEFHSWEVEKIAND